MDDTQLLRSLSSERRFQRYVAMLNDGEALILHKIVCRRAASIYGPMYQAKRDANYKVSRAIIMSREGSKPSGADSTAETGADVCEHSTGVARPFIGDTPR